MQEDLSSLRNAYSQAAIKALVLPFMERMELALGAATMAIARSGASFISEMAAAGCPSLLIPYPHSADEHQRVNARTLADANAALFMDEKEMTPQRLIAAIERLSGDILSGKRSKKICKHSMPRMQLPESASKWFMPQLWRIFGTGCFSVHLVRTLRCQASFFHAEP